MTSPSNLACALFGAAAPELRCAETALDPEPRFAYAEEQRRISHAILKRQLEFSTGRRLAHELMAELGVDAGPLLPKPTRAPAWPEGVVGSISHGADRCAVVVAPRAVARGLGIDVEAGGPLPKRLWRIVLRAEERARAEALGDRGEEWAKLAFSAKETTYKALSEDVGRVLEFREVEIEHELGSDRFRAQLLAPEAERLAPEPLEGRCLVSDERVLTALLRPA